MNDKPMLTAKLQYDGPEGQDYILSVLGRELLVQIRPESRTLDILTDDSPFPVNIWDDNCVNGHKVGETRQLTIEL